MAASSWRSRAPIQSTPLQHQVRRDQGNARHGCARLFADQAMAQQHLDVTIAVGHAALGDLGAGDRLVEGDDGQHQPECFGQVKRLELARLAKVHRVLFMKLDCLRLLDTRTWT
jgi:hypothetical protein